LGKAQDCTIGAASWHRLTIANCSSSLENVFTVLPLTTHEDYKLGAASKDLRAVYLDKFSRQIRDYWLDFSQLAEPLPETPGTPANS
jgi:hypothetical protein